MQNSQFKKYHFLLFTKSEWSEPPRLRHQLAQLLIDQGHAVYFFERAKWIFTKSKDSNRLDGVCLLRSCYLIHHQLRIFPWMAFLNGFYEKRSIKNVISKLKKEISQSENIAVFNFNYDYFFLREIFPSEKVISIINDDFEIQAKFNAGKHVRKVLQETISNSSRVLVVSEYLKKKLSGSGEVDLFFPWAMPTERDIFGVKARRVLVWGFIDHRLDFELILNLLELDVRLQIDFIGPRSSDLGKIFKLLYMHPRVSFIDRSSLDNLTGPYICSLQAYDSKNQFAETVSVTNKTFQLMTLGIPSVVSGMRNFIEEDCIYKVTSAADALAKIDLISSLSSGVRWCALRRTLARHDSSSRYAQIMSYL